MTDRCLTCGETGEFGLWCDKHDESHIRVHEHPCTLCGAIMGQITDDDYCGPEILVCPTCMTKTHSKE